MQRISLPKDLYKNLMLKILFYYPVGFRNLQLVDKYFCALTAQWYKYFVSNYFDYCDDSFTHPLGATIRNIIFTARLSTTLATGGGRYNIRLSDYSHKYLPIRVLFGKYVMIDGMKSRVDMLINMGKNNIYFALRAGMFETRCSYGEPCNYILDFLQKYLPELYALVQIKN